MRRRWLILWVTVAIMGSTLIIGLIIHEQFYRAPTKNDACHTRECINAAAQISDFIDTTVDPCDNFYKFACGNFLKTVQIPDDTNEVSTTSIINENLQKKLRECLEEQIVASEIRTFRILKMYYRACMNTEGVARRGMDVLDQILQEVGGWPVLMESWNSDSSEWYIYIYKFRKLGLNTNHILKLDIDNDKRNSTFYKLKLDKPTFTLPKEFLIKDSENEYVEGYRRFMVNAAVYLGADHYRAIRELSRTLEFETRLAEITVVDEDSVNTTMNNVIMSIRDLEENYPSVPWYEYISTLAEFQVPITRSELILVDSTAYLDKLEGLLAATPKRDQINYLVWKVIQMLLPYLTKPFRNLEFKFQSELNGYVENTPRWKECVYEVYKSLPVALSAKYIRSTINEEAIKEVHEIADTIKAEFVERMKFKEWENQNKKYKSFEKIATLSVIIGFPEDLFFDDKLNIVHKEIDVSPDDYLLSYLNITRAMENLKFKNLRRVRSKITWLRESSVADTIASYDSSSNTIKIPIGLFQGTFFNENRPKYMNYAGIGFIIGHEIGRALFVDYHNSDECFIEQFNNFTVESINETANGVSTLRSNIADAVGLRYSYAAYLSWLKTIEYAEDRLSGLHYSSEQLFWITFAVNQCSNIRMEHLRLWMAEHSVSLPEFRVMGSLQNIPSFSFDFDCSSGSQMSFEDHCAVW